MPFRRAGERRDRAQGQASDTVCIAADLVLHCGDHTDAIARPFGGCDAVLVAPARDRDYRSVAWRGPSA
jgi:hypothetical protein